MEKQRRFRSNELRDDISRVKIYKERAEKTIYRLRNSENCNVDSVRSKVDSLQKSIDKWDEEIDQKTQEVSDVQSGLHDNYLREQQTTNRKLQEKRKNEASRRKNEEKEYKRRQKEYSDNRWKNMKKEWRSERQQKRDIYHEHRRFSRNCAAVPDYLRRNLSRMPNNKGYIWRGIWLLGDLPPEKNKPQVMFERKSKDLLLIHECDEYEIRKYEKKGKNRKVLVQSIRRNPKRIGWNLHLK